MGWYEQMQQAVDDFNDARRFLIMLGWRKDYASATWLEFHTNFVMVN